MSNPKRKFKFKFVSDTPAVKCKGDGYCFGATFDEAMAAAVVGVKKDLGPDAIVVSLREVKK